MLNAKIILENVPTPILVYDLLAENFLYGNVAFCVRFGVNHNQIVKKPIEFLDTVMSSDDRRLLQEKFNAFSDGETLLMVMHHAGAEHKYYCSIKIIIQDEYAYGICVFNQVLAESKDKQEEEDGSQLSGVNPEQSHQLRSLLQTLINVSHLAKGEKDPGYVELLLTNLTKAGEKVLKLLDGPKEKQENLYARVLEFHRYEVISVIKEIIYKYTAEVARKKIHLKFISSQKEVELYTDLRVFTEVVDVLTGLAVKLTNDGDVKLEVLEIFEEGARKLAVKVMDTGIGLKKAHLEILSTFSIYLGNDEIMEEKDVLVTLVRCKSLIDKLSAEFRINSHYGIGTEVTLVFPVPPAEDIPAVDIPERRDFIPEVLIVDDDQLVNRIIQRYLAGKANIDYAQDGRRAIMAVAKKQYDIIFMDINLGVGLTGLQVVKKLKEFPEYANVPVVAVTAYAMPGDKERALAAGCSFYQSKPFRKEDILDLFNRCMGMVIR